MKKIFLASVILALFATSCKKKPHPMKFGIVEDESTESGPTVQEFAQLNIGNYWVYHEYKIDTLGNANLTPRVDSTYIPGDTIINGNTYYIYVHNPYGGQPYTNYYRDSSNYLVDINGKVLMSPTDFISVLETNSVSGVFSSTYQMADKDISLILPAGIFSTINFKGTYNMLPGFDQWGSTRYTNTRYASGVGKVSYDYYYVSSPDVYEKRLVKYNVN